MIRAFYMYEEMKKMHRKFYLKNLREYTNAKS